MCAIFGAPTFQSFTKLYDKGKVRGTYAFSGFFTAKDFYVTLKSPGIVELFPDMKFKYNEKTLVPVDFTFYLGHTQAPTSAKRTFDVETSHPFFCGDWVVAHNGVLTNYSELSKTIKDKESFNIVDSSLIPALLKQFSDNDKDDSEISIICDVLSRLKGTFGLWIYNIESGNTYIARSGSTLYADFFTNEFSSIKEKGHQSLVEGELYILTNEGVTSVGNFRPNSPFFIL